MKDQTYKVGWGGLGSGLNRAAYKNFSFTTNPGPGCGPGRNVLVMNCEESIGAPNWTAIGKDGTMRLAENKSMCLDTVEKDPHTGYPNVAVSPCIPDSPSQKWVYNTTGAPTGYETLWHPHTGYCVGVTSNNASDCANVELWNCINGQNQHWNFLGGIKVGDIGPVMDGFNGKCLSTGPFWWLH